MKKLLVMAITFSALSFAFAGKIDLNGGESIEINANTKTIVSCGADSTASNCSQATSAFKVSMEYCFKNQNGDYCARTLWPKFKASNPNCVSAGTETCILYCFKNQNGDYCANLCQ